MTAHVHAQSSKECAPRSLASLRGVRRFLSIESGARRVRRLGTRLHEAICSLSPGVGSLGDFRKKLNLNPLVASGLPHVGGGSQLTMISA